MSAETKATEPPKPDWALTRRERRAKARAEQGLPPRRRRWWIGLLVVALIGGGLFYVQSEMPLQASVAAPEEEAAEPAPETAATPASEAQREVVMQLLESEITEVTEGTLRETVKLTGNLAPTRQLGIPAEVTGHVDTVNVREGDVVAAGDVLVQIGVDTLTNQLEQQRLQAEATRAQLSLARNQLDRVRNLVDRGISASSDLESQESSVQQLEANLAAQERQVAIAEQSLEDATVTAPFDGIVSARNVDPGAYVSTGTALLTLVDIASLTVEGTVPVLYSPRLETGQPVEVRVEGIGDRLFEGQVERVAPVAAEGSRMLPVFVSIDNSDGVLKGGMFASGVVVLEETQEAIGIPASALREDESGAHVLKVEGDRVVRQGVEIARSWDRGRVLQVASGLARGDVIVTQPLARLSAGDRITVIGE